MQIKNLKEFQKSEFAQNGLTADLIQRYKHEIRNERHAMHQDFILDQMDEAAERSREFNLREKLYYKPHFGPEETDSQIEMENARVQNQKDYVKGNLNMQMDFEVIRKQNDQLKERVNDLENLQIAQDIYMAEELAMQKKKIEEK